MIPEALAVVADRLGADASSVLARLGGPLGHATRAAAAELATLDRAARKRRLAEITVLVRAPVPAGLRHVHPSWLEHALEPLPARARTALAAPTTDPVDVWLARWASAELVSPIASAIEWLADAGADQFALALGEQARAVPVLAAAADRIARPPRAGRLGPTRAAALRCRDVSLDDDLAFVRVGSRALAPHLATDQLAFLRLTRSMPRAIASVVVHEVRAHAATSLDHCPAWDAVAPP